MALVAQPGFLANTVITAGLLVFQHGATIEAIDMKTGQRRWRTRIPQPPRSSVPVLQPHQAKLPLLDYVIMTAANGLIAVSVGSSWLLLNAGTGRLLTRHFISTSTQDQGINLLSVLPESSRSILLLGTQFVEAVDPVTAQVQWRGFGSATDAVIGNALYGTDGDGRVVPSTMISRTDLTSGHGLRPLLLPRDLRFTIVRQSAEDPGALLVTGTGKIARLDPVSGRVAWTRALPAGAVGAPLQPGPSGAAPSAEYLIPPPTGARAGGWRIFLVDFATGRTTYIPLGRKFPYAAAGLTTSGLDQDEAFWDFYDGAMLAAVPARGPGGLTDTRLEGVDPRSGRVQWRGPQGAGVYVLGETFTGPPMIIAESCAPSGLVGSQPPPGPGEAYCTAERLYAINA